MYVNSLGGGWPRCMDHEDSWRMQGCALVALSHVFVEDAIVALRSCDFLRCEQCGHGPYEIT